MMGKSSHECKLFSSTSDFCSKSSSYRCPLLTYHSQLDVGLCSLGFMSSFVRPAFNPLKSESYVTIDGQSANPSLNKAPIWGLRTDFYYCQTVRVCWCGALSLTRGRICRLQLLLVLASAVILESRGTCDHILLSQNRDFFFHRLLRLSGLRWRYSTPPLQERHHVSVTKTNQLKPLPHRALRDQSHFQ
jgi:hypothetical protein